MDQLSFASLDFAAKKKRTKRDVFLAEMAAVVPWGMRNWPSPTSTSSAADLRPLEGECGLSRAM
jgi:hypothetical protein